MDTNDLKPGRELDALVAERVMGAKLRWSNLEIPPTKLDAFLQERDEFLGPPKTGIEASRRAEQRRRDEQILPPFSTDISAAWAVVEAMAARDWSFAFRFSESDRSLGATFSSLGEKEGHQEWFGLDHAPHAICLAALKAVGRR